MKIHFLAEIGGGPCILLSTDQLKRRKMSKFEILPILQEKFDMVFTQSVTQIYNYFEANLKFLVQVGHEI